MDDFDTINNIAAGLCGSLQDSDLASAMRNRYQSCYCRDAGQQWEVFYETANRLPILRGAINTKTGRFLAEDKIHRALNSIRIARLISQAL